MRLIPGKTKVQIELFRGVTLYDLAIALAAIVLIVFVMTSSLPGQLFFVLDTDEQYVYLADGKGRKLEGPKRKKFRHVRKVPQTNSRVAEKLRSGDKVLNSELRRELAVFGQKFNSQNQGGI